MVSFLFCFICFLLRVQVFYFLDIYVFIWFCSIRLGAVLVSVAMFSMLVAQQTYRFRFWVKRICFWFCFVLGFEGVGGIGWICSLFGNKGEFRRGCVQGQFQGVWLEFYGFWGILLVSSLDLGLGEGRSCYQIYKGQYFRSFRLG